MADVQNERAYQKQETVFLNRKATSARKPITVRHVRFVF